MGQCTCSTSKSENEIEEIIESYASHHARLVAAIRLQHVEYVQKTLESMYSSIDNMAFQTVSSTVNTKDDTDPYNGCTGNTLGHIISWTADSPKNAQILQMIIDYGYNINITNDHQQLPIHLACCTNNKSIVQYMIDENLVSGINQKDIFGNTPLMIAIEHDSVDCANILIAQKNVRLVATPNDSDICCLEPNPPESIAAAIIGDDKKDNDINKKDMCCLEYCASVGSGQCLSLLLSTLFAKMEINNDNGDGDNCNDDDTNVNFHEPLLLNFLSVLKQSLKGNNYTDKLVIIEKFERLCTGNSDGNLAMYGNTISHEVAGMLNFSNNSSNATNNNIDNSENWETRISILKFLVRRGYDIKSDINTFNKDGYLPIHLACKSNNKQFLNFIIEQQLCPTKMCNEKTENKQSQTPLAIAIQYDSIDCAKILLKDSDYPSIMKRDLNQPYGKDAFPCTLLEYAVHYNRPRMILLLVYILHKKIGLSAQGCVMLLGQKQVKSRIIENSDESNQTCLDMMKILWDNAGGSLFISNIAQNKELSDCIPDNENPTIFAEDNFLSKLFCPHCEIPLPPGRINIGAWESDCFFSKCIKKSKQGHLCRGRCGIICTVCAQAFCLESMFIRRNYNQLIDAIRFCNNNNNNGYGDGKKVLKTFFDGNVQDLLYYACSENKLELLKYVLIDDDGDGKRGDYINWTWDDGETTLSLASKHGNLEMIQFIVARQLAKNLDHHEAMELVNSKCDSDGNTAFLRLCKNGYLGCLEYVITGKYNTIGYLVDTYSLNDVNGNTSLHLAAIKSTSATMKCLISKVYQLQLKNIADDNYSYIANIDRLQSFFNQTNNHGQTVAHRVALIQNDENCLSQLEMLINFNENIQLDFSCPNSKESAIHTACRCNNYKFIQYWMQHETQEQVSKILKQVTNDDISWTPLMSAIAYLSVDCVKVICNCDLVDHYSYKEPSEQLNSIQFCVKYGNSNILKILLATRLNNYDVHDWESLKASPFEMDVNMALSSMQDQRDIKTNKCVILLREIMDKGLGEQEYNMIALMLDHGVTDVMSSTHRNKNVSIPNMTVFVNNSKDFGLEPVIEPKTMSSDDDKDNDNDNDDDNEDQGVALDLSINGRLDATRQWFVYDTIGKGGFGCVKRGIHATSGKEIALKFINKASNDESLDLLIASEIDALKKIDHENVIKLFAYNLNVSKDNSQVLLVCEYISKGELFHLLAVTQYFEMVIAKTYFEQILSALKVCHSFGVIHRDLKPQNLLIDKKFNIKIADFGLCKIYDKIKATSNKNKSNQDLDAKEGKDDNNSNDGSLASRVVGTKGYIAPEILYPVRLQTNIAKQAGDIFSVGVILWKMTNGIHSKPFKEATHTDNNYRLLYNKQFDKFWKEKHNDCQLVKSATSTNLKCDLMKLIEKMFIFDPHSRITIDQILNDKWYKNSKSYNSDKYKNIFYNHMNQIHIKVKAKFSHLRSPNGNHLQQIHVKKSLVQSIVTTTKSIADITSTNSKVKKSQSISRDSSALDDTSVFEFSSKLTCERSCNQTITSQN